MPAKTKRIRADELLVELGYASSREEAGKLIMAGLLRTGPDAVVKKPSDMLPADCAPIVEEPSPYVSRGAYKLLEALERQKPSLAGLVCLDVGASTGGFTDLMLQRGAAKVYAADVGKGQLHAKLRNDPRVITLESTHARDLNQKLVPEPIDIVSADVSFISATRILEPCEKLLKSGGLAFILVKPQFEAEKREAPGGVVVSEEIRQRCVEKVKSFAISNFGWEFVEALPCPIKGPKGNQEFMAVFRKPCPASKAKS